jgi:alpha-soluble NSF attachment protein
MIRSIFSKIKSGKEYYAEQDIELLNGIATKHKINRQWGLAAISYEKIAKLYQSLEELDDTCENYISAAKCYKKSSDTFCESIRLYKIVAKIYGENNKFHQSAKIYRDIAELEEKNNNINNAIDSYISASDFFQIEDKESLYIRTIAKAADLLAGNEDYDRASSYYDIIINKATETNLLKYSVKKYIFKATLCIFIISGRTLFKDIEKCKNKIENYVEQIPLYENSKEYVFLNNICLILEEDDVEEFINCAFLYDKAYKMDILSVGLLLKLKNMFREALAHNDQTGTNDFDNIDLS